MKVGVVDLGTNSMRLLITDGEVEAGRWVQVTGLGRGLDATGVLGEDAIERTIQVLLEFGVLMDQARVDARAAVATSAARARSTWSPKRTSTWTTTGTRTVKTS